MSSGMPASIELFLSDFVSDNTRRERTALLITCAVALVIRTTGLVPSKISALGIEFSAADQRSLLRIVVGVLAYLALAFTIHALSDFIQWRTIYGSLKRSEAKEDITDQHKRIANPGSDVSAAIEQLQQTNPARWNNELNL